VGTFKPRLLVFSDYVCPFCYLAVRIVQRLSQEYDIEVVWKNYEIHPQIPPAGEPESHPGKAAQAESRLLRELDPELGPRIRLPLTVANSHLAHEAAEFAREQGKFQELHSRLFQAYFEQGLNIGDLVVLVQVGAECGLDPTSLEQAVCEHRYHSRIEQVLCEKIWYGVYGTPTFVLGRYKIVGPQRYEVFQEAMRRVGAQARTIV
jgi:predicted DsbA family dithiol-disulfide isomerase